MDQLDDDDMEFLYNAFAKFDKVRQCVCVCASVLSCPLCTRSGLFCR